MDRHTDSYQCGAQTPSVSRGPAGQDSMAVVNGTPSAAHSARSTGSGSFQQVTGVDHGTAEPVEDFRLLPDAEIVQGGRGAHPGVGGQQLPGVADEEGVPQRRERVPVHLREQVMSHVLARSTPSGPRAGARSSAG